MEIEGAGNVLKIRRKGIRYRVDATCNACQLTLRFSHVRSFTRAAAVRHGLEMLGQHVEACVASRQAASLVDRVAISSAADRPEKFISRPPIEVYKARSEPLPPAIPRILWRESMPLPADSAV